MSDIWTIKFINKKAEKEIEKLSPVLQAKFLRITELLIEFGPNQVGMPHCKFLEKGLWEIRMKDQNNIARSIYCIEKEHTLIILHSFLKKTQKTPRKAIHTALKRLKEIKS